MSGPNEHMKSAVVGGTSQKVRRSRVVWMTSDFSVLEASNATASSFAVVGVAQPWTRNPAGTPFDTSLEAGNSGDEIMYYANGAEGYVELGGTVQAGNPIGPDTAARAVQAFSVGISGTYWTIGEALESGTAGDVIRFRCHIQG